jgi:AcrR family transcriptional regulator
MTTHAPARDGRQARWEKHNEERRQAILDAALAVLEAHPPGAEIHVQQIAVQAGLNRTVVYRHFADRSDLDRAVQNEILGDLAALLLPAVTLDGTVNEIIRRIVSTYVDWVVAHPALHRFADAEVGGPFQLGLAHIAGVVVELLETAVSLLGAELDDDEQAALDPLAHALVGAVLGAVRRWATREPRRPDAARISELLAESVWHLLHGHAARLGLDIDPDVPLDQLFSSPEVVS